MQKKILEIYNIIKKLRKECPADKARDEKSLIKDIGGELNEVAMALGAKDSENLSEELGDLLFTVLFLTNLCEEKYNFNIENVLNKLNNKMIFRHPHVFENPRQVTIEEAEKIWKQKKQEEKEFNIIH